MSSSERRNGNKPPREPISITDKRRVDPDTGRVREHTPSQPVTPTPQREPPPTTSDAEMHPGDRADRAAREHPDRVPELTADLQRVQAEYTNYRRRIERDRHAAVEAATASVAAKFLGILDDLDRAREHGDLETEPLRAIAAKLDAILTGLGVAAFGEEGDRFDPTLHEAVQHEGAGGDPVVGRVLRRGYTFGDRKVLRTATVTVVEGPASPGNGTGTAPVDGA
ncbi:nucleotide exchange factor GrpE [Rhodococcus sp. NM-2]|uniref:nucleotide exchange factor GrpE n=1 Tax=Rhodococcus TaxID=1827 RepID=UPI002475CB32|nr:nucleotide exchange factor GrpE [Rhodococcus opacus]MDH6289786.1 molecular chaperone GrpE [Rhodococcus opacus]